MGRRRTRCICNPGAPLLRGARGRSGRETRDAATSARVGYMRGAIIAPKGSAHKPEKGAIAMRDLIPTGLPLAVLWLSGFLMFVSVVVAVVH